MSRSIQFSTVRYQWHLDREVAPTASNLEGALGKRANRSVNQKFCELFQNQHAASC